MLDLFDVGVLLVPFEVGPAVLLLAVGFLVLVFAVDNVVDLGLVLGPTVVVNGVVMVVSAVVEAVPLEVPLVGAGGGVAFPPVVG